VASASVEYVIALRGEKFPVAALKGESGGEEESTEEPV